MRAQIGPDNFAAQYLQEPVAPDGNMIRREWVRRSSAGNVAASLSRVAASASAGSTRESSG